MVLLFVITGGMRIDAAGVDGSAALAPVRWG